jgi:hypothetical protein
MTNPDRRAHRAHRSLLTCLAVAGVSTVLLDPAYASPMLETVGAATSNNPFTARVLPSGPADAYFNPALLIGQPSAQLGSFLVIQDLSLRLKPRPEGIDVDAAIYDARVPNPDGSTSRMPTRPLPTSALRNPRGSVSPDHDSLFLVGGAVVEPIPNTLALGVFALLPTRAFQTQSSRFVDEREQYFSNSLSFERYGENFDTNLVAFGMGLRILPRLDAGLGLTLTTEGEADNEIFVPDASNQDVMHINTNVRVMTRLRPHAGLAFEPIDHLRLSSTVHLPSSNEVSGENDLQLWNFEYPPGQQSFRQSYTYRTQYMPLRVALGLAHDSIRSPDGEGWAAGATVTYTRWSDYLNRHRQEPLDAWVDTLSIAAGARWQGEVHRVGADVDYAPSPVPDQVGRTNYVDNDRLGSAVTYGIAWSIGDIRLETGLHLQAHRLIERSVTKSTRATNPVVDEFPSSIDGRTGVPIPQSAGLQTNNPGYPGFSSEGWLFGAGVSITARFGSGDDARSPR